MKIRSLGLCASLLSLLAFAPAVLYAQTISTAQPSDDPYLWLEELNGARALDWVKTENAKTLKVLQNDPHFAGFYADALAINQAKDRIPLPTIINGRVYNFWQDADHVRGIWRSTTVADYAQPAPAWTTVLDLDALAKAEGKNWTWQGADCDSPSRERCIISLSEGGEDASTLREFDLTTRSFVTGGFDLPRGKQSSAWASADTLLVSREWQSGDLTASGYPYIVKSIKRGQPLSAATEVFRGEKSDVSVNPFLLTDGTGKRALGIDRGVSFFESEKRLITPAGLRKLNVPVKSSLAGLFKGRAMLRLAERWIVNGTTFSAGSLVSFDLAAAQADPEHLAPALVYAPGPRETFENVAFTRDHVLLATYENVRGRAFVYTLGADGAWSKRKLDLADNSSIGLVDADDRGSSMPIRGPRPS